MHTNKCEFIREVAYLGNLVTKDVVQPNPSQVEVVEHFTQPRILEDIKSFLGLAAYYRVFIV